MLRHSKVYDKDHLPRHIKRHSPTGMNWGYYGSGPADLALSLLTAVVGKKLADKWYMVFKFEQVGMWKSDWSYTASDIRNWVEFKEKQ